MSQAVRRFAQIVKLKPQYLAEYKDVHARVWPDVLAQIKQCNIKDCMDIETDTQEKKS